MIAIGRSRDGPEAALFARYTARTRPALTLTELPDGKGSPLEIQRRELEERLPEEHGIKFQHGQVLGKINLDPML